FIRKWLMSCVFPGFPEVLASCFLPVSMFIREDFPTLDRPIKAYSGMGSEGHLLTSELLITNSAVCICILNVSGLQPFFQKHIKFFRVFHHRGVSAFI